MDWTTIICALIAALIPSGGIAGYVFLREDKKAKQLENDHNANNEVWTLVNKYKERITDLEATIKEKDNKIDNLYKTIGELRTLNDKLSSKVAVLTILRCKVVGCANRIPPMGSRDNESCNEEQNTNEKQE